jgi:hypothetical protein
VSPSYFFDDEAAARIDAELALLVALRDGSVRHLALRAFGLSADSLATIARMVERVRELEGLPEGEPETVEEPSSGNAREPREDR